VVSATARGRPPFPTAEIVLTGCACEALKWIFTPGRQARIVVDGAHNR
jgi:hypothetical protein